ncbi:MAG: hypothetical protein ACO3O3_13075 [Ilumatobacteraceae bacterium]
MAKNTNNGNGDNAPKRRGRAKGSTMGVTLHVKVACSDAERMALRAENMLDDASAEVSFKVEANANGFNMIVSANDGGNGRLARVALAKTLKKWHSKGRITSATILTNPIVIG